MFDGPVAWIFLVVGLIFIFGGSKRLADLGKGFGSFMKEFNKAKKEGEAELKSPPVIDEAEKQGDTKN